MQDPVVTQNSIKALIETGIAAQKRGDLSQAQSAYQAVLAQQANHFDALHLSGLVFAQQQEFAKAIELVSRAVSINGTAPEPLRNLAIIYENAKQPVNSLNTMLKYLLLSPQDLQGYAQTFHRIAEYPEGDYDSRLIQQCISHLPNHSQIALLVSQALGNLKTRSITTDVFSSTNLRAAVVLQRKN